MLIPDSASEIKKTMSEFLSQGINIEEFVSNPTPIKGVSTSITGFVGLAEYGPVGGLPVLVRNFNEFKKIFGGYLSKEQFGKFRFLAYAVEHYFANGGKCCYISRVVPKDAKPWSCTLEGRQLKLIAKSPGVWGNKLRVSFTPLLHDKLDIRIGYVDTDIAE